MSTVSPATTADVLGRWFDRGDHVGNGSADGRLVQRVPTFGRGVGCAPIPEAGQDAP